MPKILSKQFQISILEEKFTNWNYKCKQQQQKLKDNQWT
jgi:hypothetical protein